MVPNSGDAASYDRYTYVRNNPVRYSDPSGHRITCGDGDAGGCGGSYSFSSPITGLNSANKSGDTKKFSPLYDTKYFTNEKLIFAAIKFTWALKKTGVVPNAKINEGSRTPQSAHIQSTAYMITTNPEVYRNAEKNPVDNDGNVWWNNACTNYACQGLTIISTYKKGVDTVIGEKGIACLTTGFCLGNPFVMAYEGYPQNDPRRLPNSNNIDQSNHVLGLAVDINIIAGNWNDKRIDDIARQFGLERPFNQDG